ncbi:MAG: cupredoxin domain-containing protein [Gemmatimonadales bacterium]
MTATQTLVLLAGVATIAWINWYFFMARGSATAATATSGGIQEVVIRVEGGYSPSQVRVRAGQPVRLVFDRQEENSCSEEIVIPDFGIRRFLPAHARTTVEFTPSAPGTHEFTCGMSMLRGRLTVEEGA